jgi:phosphoribosyl-ATP pyrophosphohydrolase/phosphoribosyl-AMP cyclohydrolase
LPTDEEALPHARERRNTLLGRSRQSLAQETSGNFQKVRAVSLDCDCDAVLVEVEPRTRMPHGEYSCFGVVAGFGGTIQQLYALVEDRRKKRP